jgi:hypothetical protein
MWYNLKISNWILKYTPRVEVLFNEWLSFNLTGLQKEFIENNNEDFINFCKDGYKSECEGLI